MLTTPTGCSTLSNRNVAPDAIPTLKALETIDHIIANDGFPVKISVRLNTRVGGLLGDMFFGVVEVIVVFSEFIATFHDVDVLLAVVFADAG